MDGEEDPANKPLEDYWKECDSFEEVGQTEDEEEDCSKTPDEGEVEAEWLRQAGFQNLVDSELTEQDETEFYEDLLNTLTARQMAVVKRRLETVQISKKMRNPRSRQRADVRELFSQTTTSTPPPQSLPNLHSEPSSLDYDLRSYPSTERWSFQREAPEEHSSRGSSRPPLAFLRTGHSGGFSLRDAARAMDCESPTSVEVLRYETRTSLTQENEPQINGEYDLSQEHHSLETGFQEISSRMSCDLTNTDLASLRRDSNVQMGDLSDEDRQLVRSLAVIEAAALLDGLGLAPTRRKKPHRKKGKETFVFGESLENLLEIDRKRCSGIKIPLIYQWILHHLHSNGLREEGLMRLGGSVQKIQLLKTEIEKNYVTSPALIENLIGRSSVHDVSALLKQLVRHLPEPLLTNSHMDAFLQVPNIPNVQDQLNALNLLVLSLPDTHRELLQELLCFLSRVVEQEASNRMSLSNVSMVMAPNLFPPPHLKGRKKAAELAAEVTVAATSSNVTRLLVHYERFLGSVPPELLAQARLQNRRTSHKIAKRIGYRKPKAEKHKNAKEDPSLTIRVQVASLRHTSGVSVGIGERTTAGEVVEKVVEAFELVATHRTPFEQQENRALMIQRPRTRSEPVTYRQLCFESSKKPLDYLKDHFLYHVRENIGERRLDHGTNVLSSAGSGSNRFGFGSTWEIRCHH